MMSKDESLKMAIKALEAMQMEARYRNCGLKICDEAINACKEALEPEPMTTTDVITCKMAGKCCMTGEALEQPLTRDWKHTIEERIARDSEFKEALEQPAQEPVALLEALSDLEHQQWMKWAKSIIDSEPISEARKQRWLTMMVDYKDLPDNIKEYDREWARKIMELYTHPHQWVGLTDKEIFNLSQQCDLNHILGLIDYGRAVEQALKDKNT